MSIICLIQIPKNTGGGVFEIPYISPDQLKELDDLIVIIMVRDATELEQQFLDWGIPYVAGFELLLEMSLGKVVTAEQFENNKILDVYDLMERIHMRSCWRIV